MPIVQSSSAASAARVAEREPILQESPRQNAAAALLARLLPAPPQRRWALLGAVGLFGALAAAVALLGAAKAQGELAQRHFLSPPPGLEGVGLWSAAKAAGGKQSKEDNSDVGMYDRRPVAPLRPPSNAQRLPWRDSTENGDHLSGGNEAKLLGKTLRVTIDVSQIGCGCVAGFYLYQGYEPYCDASGNFDGRCGEIDLFEGNRFAWHSTLHNTNDHPGLAGGFGGMQQPDMMYGEGPRDMTGDQYGPGGSVIDTEKTFNAAVSFPKRQNGSLADMVIMLYQDDKDYAIEWRVNKKRAREGMDCTKSDCPNCFSKPGCVYEDEDLHNFGQWLSDGMTMQSTLWPTDEPWLDGVTESEKGGCKVTPSEANTESYGKYTGPFSECGLHHPWYKVGDWTLEDIEEPAAGWDEIFRLMDRMPLIPVGVQSDE